LIIPFLKRFSRPQGFYLGLWEQKRGNLSGAMRLFEEGAHFGDGKAWCPLAEMALVFREGARISADQIFEDTTS